MRDNSEYRVDSQNYFVFNLVSIQNSSLNHKLAHKVHANFALRSTFPAIFKECFHLQQETVQLSRVKLSGVCRDQQVVIL